MNFQTGRFGIRESLKTIVRVFNDFASGNSIHEGFDFVKILLAGSALHTGTEVRCMENTHFLQQGERFQVHGRRAAHIHWRLQSGWRHRF